MDVVPISLGIVKSFLLSGSGNELVLVDAGNPGDGGKIIKKVEEAGYRANDISLIVLTHGHKDHVGGLAELEEELSARVIIHNQDALALTEGKEPGTQPTRLLGRLFKVFIPEGSPPPPSEEPEIIEEDRVSLKGFGIDGEIIHTPGHTRGSLAVVSEGGAAVIGDLVMGRFLVFGGASIPVFAEEQEKLKDSIRKVLSYNPEIIYTSHAGPFEREDLERILD